MFPKRSSDGDKRHFPPLGKYLHPDNPHTPCGVIYSSFHLRTLVLLRMPQTLTALRQERSIAYALYPWSLLGKPEPSFDIWEAGSPVVPLPFLPFLRQLSCGRGLSCPTQPALRELVQAPGFLSTALWCFFFVSSSL